MNKRMNFGFSTILISFIMISIVTFCALALVTANSDYKLSQKVATRNTGYYQAEKVAYEKLALLDEALYNNYLNSKDKAEYLNQAAKLPSEMGGTFTNEDTPIYTFQCDISDNQYLEVSVEIVYPTTPGNAFYNITSWCSIHVEDTFEEQPLNLMNFDQQ